MAAKSLFPLARRAFATSSESSDKPVYLVFGAAGGIGSALVQRLAPTSRLVLSGDHEDKLKQLKQHAQDADIAAANAEDPEAVERVVMRALERHGRVDGVANCIGNVVARSALATGLKELEDELRVNLYTSFNIVRSSVKAMVEQHASGEQQRHGQGDRGGSIVLVSAAVASHGLPNYEAMSAAKAGVEGLARSAAATYAAKGVRINCVAPGLTKTPQTQPMTDNERVRDVSKQMHPLKTFAEPSDIASAIDFLLRPDNSFITGQVLAVDGGLCTLHPHHAEDYGV